MRPLTSAVWLLTVLCVAAGCGRTVSEDASSSGQAAPSAREVLDKMIAAYRKANVYADSGELYFQGMAEGRPRRDSAIPYSISFQRPNKLRLHQFGAVLVSDGQTVRAAVMDIGGISGIPGQVLETKAPAELKTNNFLADEILQNAVTWGIEEIVSPQLALLVGEHPPEAANHSAETVLLEDRQIDGRECYRVEVTRPAERRTYWIDKQSFELRQLDIDSDEIQQRLDPERKFSSLIARLELKGARLGGSLDQKAFKFEVPEGARRVRRFVPPVPDPPERIGERISEFSFRDLDGGRVTQETVAGKVVVLTFWFTSCAPCKIHMPILDKDYQKYKDDERVAFLAVSVDDPSLDGAKLTETLGSWGATLPIVRDLDRQSETKFKIPGEPTTFIFGPDGKIHLYQPGFNPQGQGYSELIDRLLAGKDVAQQVLDNHEAERKAFELELTRQSVEAQSQMIEVPSVGIASASEPQSFQRSLLWQCPEVKQPGNILVTSDSDGAVRIFVLDGWKTVVELDAAGKVVQRHELEIPQRTGVSYLRSQLDAAGSRWFVAAAVSQQQLYLLDNEWKLRLSFPEAEHAGIADVQLADLDGDESLELVVGYLGLVGVQGVSLKGERLWSNRSVQDVWQVAVTGPDDQGHREVLAINRRGTLATLDHQGKEGPDLVVRNRALTKVVAADVDGDGSVEMCALAAEPGKVGKLTAIGLDREGGETWSYVLPEGFHQHPVELIVPANLPGGDGGWIFPAADGSIHLLTAEGDLVDRFNYGSALTGLALAMIEGHPVFLVSSQDGLAAWKVEVKPQVEKRQAEN